MIQSGLLTFWGFHKNDTIEQAKYCLNKCLSCRLFEDSSNKMNLSLTDTKKELLIVSQFTLYGNCNKGRRPSFEEALEPQKAQELYDQLIQLAKETYPHIQTGQFREKMTVNSENDGPVTIILEK